MTPELAGDQQNPDTPGRSEETACSAPSEQNGYQYPRLGIQAMHAFHRELAQLLQERPGQWVAYHGEERVGFASTQTELWQRCLASGFHTGDFIVRCVEPEIPGLVVPPLPE